jgi:hypothetical protein
MKKECRPNNYHLEMHAVGLQMQEWTAITTSFLFFSFLLTACGYFLLFDKYVLPLSLYIHFS